MSLRKPVTLALTALFTVSLFLVFSPTALADSPDLSTTHQNPFQSVTGAAPCRPAKTQRCAPTKHALPAPYRMSATARLTFYSCEEGYCGWTASGRRVEDGTAACDRSVMPFGTRFIIEGDPTGSIWTCWDTGGGVRGWHVDVWFPTNAQGWGYTGSLGQSVVINVLK